MSKRYKNPEEAENAMIENILDNFDFYKCWTVMKLLEWSWGMNAEIPNIDRLKSAAANRLKDAIEIAKKGESPHLTYFVSSGGLKATAWRNRYRQIEAINLEFVLTDWQSDGDC